MSNIARLLAGVIAAAVLSSATLSPIGTAMALTKSESADMETARKQTQMALEKSQGQADFMSAVKAKNADRVKAILLRNGASKFLTDVLFEGGDVLAGKPVITITVSCCPKVKIVIRF